MALFDRYLIVDWSAANSPKLGKDSIWLCRHENGKQNQIENPATRKDAMWRILGMCQAAKKLKKRLFIGFDFGFGYPAGTAALLTGTRGWEQMWAEVARRVNDNDQNKSNRFEVADQWNRWLKEKSGDAPFWGLPPSKSGKYENLGAHQPTLSVLPARRIVERHVASTQPVWKLCYPGSVGSQTILGIYWLEWLRNKLDGELAIWPFETGFDADMTSQFVAAEIYPSLFARSAAPGEIKDETQVRVTAEQFCRFDGEGRFSAMLSRPDCLSDAEAAQVISEEGWIVGAGHAP